MPLLAVDTVRMRVDHACVHCRVVRRGLGLGTDLVVVPGASATTSAARLTLTCVCGTVETMLDLGPEHADASNPAMHAFHVEQTHLIRAAKLALGAPLRPAAASTTSTTSTTTTTATTTTSP